MQIFQRALSLTSPPMTSFLSIHFLASGYTLSQGSASGILQLELVEDDEGILYNN